MAVATSPLRSALDRDGYVLVPGVVPHVNLEAVVRDVWNHTGARPDDRESWYNAELISKNGMVEMYHYQSMWDNRQLPRLHEVFSEVYGTPKMSPAQDGNEELRQTRITCWRERRPPPGTPFPGDPRHIEEEHGKTAELTALGRKLLGLDRW